MDKNSHYIAGRLETARRSKDFVYRISWMTWVAVTALAFVLVVALMDRWLMLSRGVRFAGWSVLVALVIYGLFRLWQMTRRPTDLKTVALDLEAARPELGCAVSTAAEYLGDQRPASGRYEPEIIQALHEQTAKSLTPLSTNYGQKFLRPAAFFFLAAIAAMLFAVLLPSADTSMHRVLTPWANVTYTRVAVTPGNVEIPQGANQTVSCIFSGILPKEPQLEWRDEKNSIWQSTALNRAGDDWTASLQGVSTNTLYRVTGNDVVSSEYRITTYLPPQIKQTQIQVKYPAYTQHAPKDETDPDLTILRGSQLNFRITSSGPIAGAVLHFTNAPDVTLTAAPGNTWTATLLPTNEAYYAIELTDTHGHKSTNSQLYHLVVQPDEVPVVQIPEPGTDIRANPHDRIPVKITATDDYGIGKLNLVYHQMGGPLKTIPCKMEGTNRMDVSANTEIDLTPEHLGEFQLIAYYAEARDNNTLDGPGLGRSPVYFIEITTRERPLSESSGGGGQKINLLDVEKQLIAATTRTGEKDAERMADLATAQRSAKELAENFQATYVIQSSPAEAKARFAAAIEDMESAASDLDDQKQKTALKSEENALANLYQAARLLPEFESQCRGGACKKTVLEAIEKQKKTHSKELAPKLAQAIGKLKKLASDQKSLDQRYHDSLPGHSPGDAKNSPPGGEPKTPSEQQAKALAAEQKALSDHANELAEKLHAIASKDPRVSHGYGKNMQNASGKMKQASEQISEKKSGAAGMSSGSAITEMEKTLSALVQIENNNARPTDPSDEDFPKEFESKIADYFHRLSYQE